MLCLPVLYLSADVSGYLALDNYMLAYTLELAEVRFQELLPLITMFQTNCNRTNSVIKNLPSFCIASCALSLYSYSVICYRVSLSLCCKQKCIASSLFLFSSFSKYCCCNCIPVQHNCNFPSLRGVRKELYFCGGESTGAICIPITSSENSVSKSAV